MFLGSWLKIPGISKHFFTSLSPSLQISSNPENTVLTPEYLQA
jgi:hypothetical protein